MGKVPKRSFMFFMSKNVRSRFLQLHAMERNNLRIHMDSPIVITNDPLLSAPPQSTDQTRSSNTLRWSTRRRHVGVTKNRGPRCVSSKIIKDPVSVTMFQANQNISKLRIHHNLAHPQFQYTTRPWSLHHGHSRYPQLHLPQ